MTRAHTELDRMLFKDLFNLLVRNVNFIQSNYRVQLSWPHYIVLKHRGMSRGEEMSISVTDSTELGLHWDDV